MALFEKKSSAEKIISMFNSLTDEDKEKVKNHFMEKAEDIEKAEDEREIDKIEEDKAETETEHDEKKEEVEEETEEIGKDVEEAEAEEPKEEERHEDLFGGLDARIKALEDKFDKMLAMTEDDEDRDIGISGYGVREVDNMDIDKRSGDIVNKLGGYASKR